MKLITMTEAMDILNAGQKRDGDAFSKKWNLTPILNNVMIGRGKLRLFDRDEVEARKQEADQHAHNNMDVVTMTEAMKILGTTTAMHGEEFAKKWGLTLIPVGFSIKRDNARLFARDEVEARKREIDQQVIDNARREYAQSTPVTKADLSVLRKTVDDYQSVLYRIEEKLDRLLAAFDLPLEEAP